jgi:hypothetical protein
VTPATVRAPRIPKSRVPADQAADAFQKWLHASSDDLLLRRWERLVRDVRS